MVDTFTYIGVVTSKGGCDEGIAKGKFCRLRQIWNSSIFSIKIKIKPFNCLVISILAYGSETWKNNITRQKET